MLRPMSRWVILALVALLAACDDESQQACEPGNAERCAVGESCAVDRTGTPVCIGPGQAEEGALCRLAEDPTALDPAVHCGAEMGCVRISGVSRCLRFCTPGLDRDPCQPEGDAPLSVGKDPELLRDFARCVGVLPDRPEIGLCVLPCRPDRRVGCPDTPAECVAFADDCPTGTVCGIDPQAPVPVCVPEGAALEGETCGGESGCALGLLCARIDGRARCAMPTNENDGCPSDRIKVPVAGVYDPLVRNEGTLQSVCLPSAPETPTAP